MRKTGFVVLILLMASFASAQVLINPGGGSSSGGPTTIISGTTPITGGADTQVCFNDGGVISCGDSGLIYAKSTKIATLLGGLTVGSVTTAARSTINLLDTITGSSATSNWFNITGTWPASLSAETNAILASITINNQGQNQFVLHSKTSGTGGINTTAPIYGEATHTGSYAMGALLTSTGAATASMGLMAYATAGTNQFGGIFSLGFVTNPTGSAAIVGDNRAVAADIMSLRDNGSVVWTVADGGYVQNTRGEVGLAANYTNATATFSSTALSVDVVSGRTYSFNLNLMFSDSTAADGAQFDFSGGSAAATNFRVQCTAANDAGAALVITNAASTALATAVQVALALTTQSSLTCAGTFVPSGNGTFIVRGAQTAHTAGTLTINRGSFLSVRDTRPL